MVAHVDRGLRRVKRTEDFWHNLNLPQQYRREMRVILLKVQTRGDFEQILFKVYPQSSWLTAGTTSSHCGVNPRNIWSGSPKRRATSTSCWRASDSFCTRKYSPRSSTCEGATVSNSILVKAGPYGPAFSLVIVVWSAEALVEFVQQEEKDKEKEWIKESRF